MKDKTQAFLLGSDLGTSGCKSIVLDSQGLIRGWALESYPTRRLQPGWAEQNPEEWFQAFCNTTRRAIQQAGITAKQIAMICIVGIYRCVFGEDRICGWLLGLAGAVLWVFNPIVAYANGYAWNNDAVILCVLASFWLYLGVDWRGRAGAIRLAAMGGLLTLATFMRMTTALVAVIFFAALLLQPADSLKQRVRRVWPFVAAGFVVMIWPLWLFVQAPRPFYVDVFRIHMLNSRWLAEVGMVFDKLHLLEVCLLEPAYFVLLVLAVLLPLLALVGRRRLKIHDVQTALLAGVRFSVDDPGNARTGSPRSGRPCPR